MRPFQIIQEKFAIFGITAAQSIQKQPFNRKVLLAYFIYSYGWTSSAVFLIQKANTFEEYTSNIYITTATAIIIFCFTVVVSRMSKLFEFIDACEEIIDRGDEKSNIITLKFELFRCFF